MKRTQSPLSPHLQVYKPQISSSLSILHRFTGIFLAFIYVVFSVIIGISILTGHLNNLFLFYYHYKLNLIISPILSAAIIFFFLGFIRHFIWHHGNGFSKKAIMISGILQILITFTVFCIAILGI